MKKKLKASKSTKSQRTCRLHPETLCENCEDKEYCIFLFCQHIDCMTCKERYMCPMCNGNCKECQHSSICTICAM